jgi:hypothetical protein
MGEGLNFELGFWERGMGRKGDEWEIFDFWCLIFEFF